jgi:hypothetical protein
MILKSTKHLILQCKVSIIEYIQNLHFFIVSHPKTYIFIHCWWHMNAFNLIREEFKSLYVSWGNFCIPFCFLMSLSHTWIVLELNSLRQLFPHVWIHNKNLILEFCCRAFLIYKCDIHIDALWTIFFLQLFIHVRMDDAWCTI